MLQQNRREGVLGMSKLSLFRVFLLPALFAALLFVFPVRNASAGDPKAGAKIFGGVCISCHGENGQPMIPGVPSFAKGERLEKSDEQLKNSIKNGVNNPKNPGGLVMPPYGGGPKLTDKQLDDVIAYIRTLKK